GLDGAADRLGRTAEFGQRAQVAVRWGNAVDLELDPGRGVGRQALLQPEHVRALLLWVDEALIPDPGRSGRAARWGRKGSAHLSLSSCCCLERTLREWTDYRLVIRTERNMLTGPR